MTSAGEYAAAGVDLAGADAAKARIGAAVAGTRTALSVGQVGAFGGMVRVPGGMRKPTLVLSTDGVGTKVLVALEAGRFDTVGEDLVNHSVNDILVHGATPHRVHGLHRGIGARGRADRRDRRRDRARLPRTTAWRSPAGRPRRCRASTSRAPTTSPARSSAWSRRTRRCMATRSCPATCCWATRPPGCTPTATPWPGRIVFETMGLGLDDRLGDTGQHRGRRAARGAPELLPRASPRCSIGCTGWPTSPAAASRETWCGSSRPSCEAVVDPAAWDAAAAVRRAAAGGRRLHRGDARRVQPRCRNDRGAAGRRRGGGAARRGRGGRRHLAHGRDPPGLPGRAVRPALTA